MLKLRINYDAETIKTDDFHYDLFQGRIDPKKLLSCGGNEVNNAINLILEFEQLIEGDGLLEYH